MKMNQASKSSKKGTALDSDDFPLKEGELLDRTMNTFAYLRPYMYTSFVYISSIHSPAKVIRTFSATSDLSTFILNKDIFWWDRHRNRIVRAVWKFSTQRFVYFDYTDGCPKFVLKKGLLFVSRSTRLLTQDSSIVGAVRNRDKKFKLFLKDPKHLFSSYTSYEEIADKLDRMK